ncbi:hypothetical protein Emag_000433 [Eimeria magna]
MYEASILPFNDFLLVGFASGAITAYTADGEREYCFVSEYLSTMEGEGGGAHFFRRLFLIQRLYALFVSYRFHASMGEVAAPLLLLLLLLLLRPVLDAVHVLALLLLLLFFAEKGSLAAHESGDLKAVCALGGTHFVSCGDDGAIAIWKWAVQQDPAAAQHKP